ncbi:penicillin-binding protein, 1A family [Parvibaculum lavamentivorans DS-1]|uniref:Penicillin-binding protein 1A n=1 Tax=Parvibaculum lavamentivorans (strain DS-1 / DSM 13023 / NCIMB 13966) TaxID=402881 RepID=A7HY98_PARL1|nr:penicillin-binding protein 1A [Parvibaculum lavamentivorans]ABS64881.1 penicillin-binding protein, 1A family [Parvibaculum lavamentivorans DS-1]
MLRVFSIVAAVFLVLVFGGVMAGTYMIWRLNDDLPDYSRLANYEPPVMTRVHAGDGQLIGEFARERRLYVPISAIPARVINAFLAAEDKNFYSHGGVDATGILRATIDNVFNVMQDRRLVGASTITQQVAKNFLLSSDVTLDRKLREALLALRLEHAFTKDQILELYLNEIYLGIGAYGVAAAALNYFDKSLDELTVAEAAYLATLPKGPNNYHPYRHRERAVARRNWVISRMEEERFVTGMEAAEARAAELDVSLRSRGVQMRDANYFVEQVRRELLALYGEQKLYEGGLSVRTTIDTSLQEVVADALRDGLIAYDRRHGWRGPVKKLEPGENWQEALAAMDVGSDLAPWTLATVLDVAVDKITIGLRPRRLPDGKFETEIVKGTVPLSAMTWARPTVNKIYLGPEVKSPSDVVAVGDVIYVSPKRDEEKKITHYALEQVPAVNGAALAMDPHTGRILAMQGGFSFGLSEFNRAVQALRQPGSSFKPFVYAAALDKGFTPSSLVLDAPFVLDQGGDLGLWKPENYERTFHGPSTLRFGLEHSRNVMTVRLAQYVGPETVSAYARRFGIMDNMAPVLSMSLGAGETTLARLVSAYAILDNGGKRVTPTLIDRVQDRFGRTIYRKDDRPCADCSVKWQDAAAPAGDALFENAGLGPQPPRLPDNREQVENPQTAYQVTSMLEGVVQRGTGSAVKAVGVPLAGKTGTTNDGKDAWFIGYSPNLVVGVFVGFDEPTPLGRAETGGRAAAPIFRDIMMKAVGNKPAIPFRVPPGISLVKVNAKTGKLADGEGAGIILEAFKQGSEPHFESAAPTVGLFGNVPAEDEIAPAPFIGGVEPGTPGAVLDGAPPAADLPPGTLGQLPPGMQPASGLPAEIPEGGIPTDRIEEATRPSNEARTSGNNTIGSGTGGLY